LSFSPLSRTAPPLPNVVSNAPSGVYRVTLLRSMATSASPCCAQSSGKRNGASRQPFVPYVVSSVKSAFSRV
jgi:hypothetical protein